MAAYIAAAVFAAKELLEPQLRSVWVDLRTGDAVAFAATTAAQDVNKTLNLATLTVRGDFFLDCARRFVHSGFNLRK
jgi:hypothetical protein